MDESNKDQTEQEPIIYSSVFQPYVEPNTSAKPTADIVPPAVEEPVKRDWAWLHPIELLRSVFGGRKD